MKIKLLLIYIQFRFDYMKFFAVFIFTFPVSYFTFSQTSVKDTAFSDFFRRTSGWEAGDEATSIPLADGRDLWIFGDSHINGYDAATGTVDCNFQVHNAGLIYPMSNQDSATTLVGNTTGFYSYFKNGSVENPYFWAYNGYQEGDTIYVYLNTIENISGGFETTGHDYIGKVLVSTMKPVAYMPLDSSIFSYGCGFVKDTASGYVYAYGALQSSTAFLTWNIYVARFPITNISPPWQYWNGSTWANTIDTGLAAAVGIGYMSTNNVCRINGKYVLFSSAFSYGSCDQGKTIYAASSNSPTGPFTIPQPVYVETDTLDGLNMGHIPFNYSVNAHPEYINEQGVLVTYCVNGYGSCLPYCNSNNRLNPDYYRPQAIRVPLALVLGDSTAGVTNYEKQINGGITVSPNPVSNQLIIYDASLRANETATVSIMNVLGQDVSTTLNIRRLLSEAEVDVSKLPAGIYFVQLATDKERWVTKFVKE